MYISTKCTEIQASWYYMQHFHSSLLATAFNSFISLYSFLDAFFLISIRFFTFCTSFTCTKSWQIFPTVTYFQTCSMRWNTQRDILSCTSIGRNLGDDGNSTALPTPCSRGGQRDGEVVCLALGFFSPQTDFYRVFLSKHLLAALASEGRTFPAAWWLQQCWQVGSGLSLAVWALLSIPSLEGLDAPTTVVP